MFHLCNQSLDETPRINIYFFGFVITYAVLSSIGVCYYLHIFLGQFCQPKTRRYINLLTFKRSNKGIWLRFPYYSKANIPEPVVDYVSSQSILKSGHCTVQSKINFLSWLPSMNDNTSLHRRPPGSEHLFPFKNTLLHTPICRNVCTVV